MIQGDLHQRIDRRVKLVDQLMRACELIQHPIIVGVTRVILQDAVVSGDGAPHFLDVKALALGRVSIGNLYAQVCGPPQRLGTHFRCNGIHWQGEHAVILCDGRACIGWNRVARFNFQDAAGADAKITVLLEPVAACSAAHS